MFQALLNWLGGGVIRQFTDPLLAAYQVKINAQNDSERLEAEKDIARLEAARDIALSESGRAWSATSVGRWLIVVPYGLWWTSIFLIQMLNPWLLEPVFNVKAIVYAIPSEINEMAKILIPAIVIADAGALIMRRR